MKLKEKINRFCPYCNKHALHKISQVKSGGKRGSLKRGSLVRARRRGLSRGYGNLGKYGSKPAVTKFKRTIKGSKKIALVYACSVCGKKHVGGISKRVRKFEIK